MSKAVLVGCDYEGTENELRGCSNDVKLVRDLLVNRNYNCVLLTDDRSILNSSLDPTYINIVKNIKYNLRGPNLFFHYSGHGTRTRDTSGDETDGFDEIIVPLDFYFITDDKLNKLFSSLSSDSKIIVLMDSCYSGTVLDLTYVMTDNFKSKISNIRNKIKCDMIMISGCKDSQTSADAYLDNEFKGALTSSFLDTYSKFGFDIKVCEYITHMRTYLRNKGFSQYPLLSFSKRDSFNKLMSHYITS